MLETIRKQIKESQAQLQVDADFEDKIKLVNYQLGQVTGTAYLTPYIALQRVAKVLAQHNMIVPKAPFLDPDFGDIDIEINTFPNDVTGLDGTGEFTKPTDVVPAYTLKFSWGQNEKGEIEAVAEVVENSTATEENFLEIED